MLHVTQRLITEQRAIASALRDMRAAVDAGTDAGAMLTGAAFRALLERLKAAQRLQTEVITSSSSPAVVRRQFPKLVEQGNTLMLLLTELSSRATQQQPPQPPQPQPPQPQPQRRYNAENLPPLPSLPPGTTRIANPFTESLVDLE